MSLISVNGITVNIILFLAILFYPALFSKSIHVVLSTSNPLLLIAENDSQTYVHHILPLQLPVTISNAAIRNIPI